MAKNKIQDGDRLYLAVAAGTKSGDPVLVGALHGVSLIDRDSAGKATVDLQGVYDLSVKAIDSAGNSAVAVGDHIYIVDADTPKLSKKQTGNFFGYALEAVLAGGTDTINVLVVRAPGPGTADILAKAIGKAELAGGFMGADIIAGGAAGNHTVTGIATGDELVAVVRLPNETQITQAVVNGAAAGDVTVTGIATADSLVSVLRHASGVKVTLVAGGAAGAHAVAGIAAEDKILFVGHFETAAAIATLADLTGEFTIAGAGSITNAGGTDTTNDQLMVMWQDASAGVTDLTAEFTISAANTINNAAGTATTGDRLVVTFKDASAAVVAADLTAEFTISAANTINNAAGTATTGDKLLVIYLDLT